MTESDIKLDFRDQVALYEKEQCDKASQELRQIIEREKDTITEGICESTNECFEISSGWLPPFFRQHPMKRFKIVVQIFQEYHLKIYKREGVSMNDDTHVDLYIITLDVPKAI